MAGEIDVYFNAALELTKEAGMLILQRCNGTKTNETKSCDIDFVTETDKQVEKLLIGGLGTRFPEHKFIGEETVSVDGPRELTDAPTWIIDPVDGTLNLVHGFPHSSISVALFVDQQPVIGIIFNPAFEQLFTAKRNQGAFLNGKRIYVSGEKDLVKGLIMMENGTSRDPERYKVLSANYQTLVPIVHGTRSLGSAALNMAMVALGAADAYYEFGTHIWDIAAGEIIVTEAGGVIIDPAGGPLDRKSRRFLCASTKALAEQLAQKLEQYYPTPRD